MIDTSSPFTSPDGPTTWFIHDGNNVVLTLEDDDGSGLTHSPEVAHRLLWGPAVDQILADESVEDDATYWFLTDHQNTVRDVALYDGDYDTTSVVNHVTYDDFGSRGESNDSLAEFDLGYTGRWFDRDTGLQNNFLRWYDASTGRWMSEDPIGFAAGDANLFRYVGNSPVMYVDPSGELKWSGSVTVTFWGSLIGSAPKLDLIATAEDGTCIYKVEYHGSLISGNRKQAVSGMVGFGYFRFDSIFNDVEGRAEWPVGSNDVFELANVGMNASVEVQLAATVQKYTIGDLVWWDYLSDGGVNLTVFGGGATGEIDYSFLKRTKGRIVKQ